MTAVRPVLGAKRLVLGDGLRPIQVVLRHVIPRVVEATLIPSTIFYLVWHFVGVWAALFAALAYAVGLIVRRIMTGRPVPALVVIAACGLTVRTLISIGTGSTFIYFLLPILATTCIAGTFLVSVLVGRPLVNRIAVEFCPLTDEDAARHAVQRLFRNLTLFWAAVLLTHAALTLSLLLTLSADHFVAIKSLTGPALTVTAVVCTVAWSVRVARREGLAAPSRRTRAGALAA